MDRDNSLVIHVTNDTVFAENGFILHVHNGTAAWIIDPGLPPQAKNMLSYISDRRLSPEAIVLTHAHADHIAGIDELLDALGPVPVYLSEVEWPMLRDPNENLSASMGMPISSTKSEDVRDLAVGSELKLDSKRWSVGDVSGHSPGGRSLYCAAEGVVFAGDALFAGSIGRVDFPHSNGEKLMSNIHATLLTLPDHTRVLSGHGPETTIGAERSTNPFILHGL